MGYHILAFFMGFLLDLLFGDPYWLPHPVRFLGFLIARMEKALLGGDCDKAERSPKREKRKGGWLVILVLAITGGLSAGMLVCAYRIHPIGGWAVETLMTYQILAVKCLKKESRKVYDKLKAQDLPGARKAVSMIVGRDTQNLDETGVIKAAIETVAENTSDGAIAPMIYLALGGPILAFLYKAVNTMDSMVGYKNERYVYFGYFPARLDDAVNFIPARISAWLMMAVCFLSGRDYDGRHGYVIFKRDRYNHASPNSAQTESVCAGALNIQLAGRASYFGKIVEKPYIGDALRKPAIDDINRANHLLYGSAWLCQGICLLIMSIIWRLA